MVYTRVETAVAPPRIERRTPGHTISIAVIGSRRFTNAFHVYNSLDRFTTHYPNFLVVSGGAVGVDTYATDWAAHRNLSTVVHPIRPWHKWMTPDEWARRDEGRKVFAEAANRRNHYICDDADIIVAFFATTEHDGGTAHSWRYAWNSDKPFFCFHGGRNGGWHRNPAADALKAEWDAS